MAIFVFLEFQSFFLESRIEMLPYFSFFCSIVNKLLTQIFHERYMKAKDILDLNIIETELKNNEYVENVELYWKFHDVLEIRIKEREPLYILKKENF